MCRKPPDCIDGDRECLLDTFRIALVMSDYTKGSKDDVKEWLKTDPKREKLDDLIRYVEAFDSNTEKGPEHFTEDLIEKMGLKVDAARKVVTASTELVQVTEEEKYEPKLQQLEQIAGGVGDGKLWKQDLNPDATFKDVAKHAEGPGGLMALDGGAFVKLVKNTKKARDGGQRIG